MLHTETPPSYNYRTGSHTQCGSATHIFVLSREKYKVVRRDDLMGREWELKRAKAIPNISETWAILKSNYGLPTESQTIIARSWEHQSFGD